MSLLGEAYDDSDHVDNGDHGIDSLLLRAALKGNATLCEKYLENKESDINHEDEHGNTAFMTAAACGHLAVCQLLLQHGADINHYNMDGCTALCKAAEGNHADTCKFLIDQGATVNHTNNDGRTPLMLAAIAGGAQTCSCLIQHRAKINLVDNHDLSALDMAIELNHPEVSRILRENGADDSLGKKRKKNRMDKDCVLS